MMSDTGTDAAGPAVTPARATKVFGVSGLAILTFAFLANVNTTPQLAKFGLGSIVLFLMAIFLFLTPTAMTSAEMGAAWPRTGGIYVWTRLAFGEGIGFIVIWLEWANFVIAWPSLMGTFTLQASYAVNPNLNDSTAFLVVCVVVITWFAALIALRGMEVTKIVAWYSVLAGSVIPAILLVAFAIAYLAEGHQPAMDIGFGALVPDFSFENIAFISGALLMFSGIEIAAIHAGDVRKPGRTIPRANFIAVGLCLLLFLPLTLAISIVIPSSKINIVVGLPQAADVIFSASNVGWLTPVFCFLIVSGLVASLVQIVNGPSRGLLVAGREGGNLPPFLQKENRRKMPVAIIIAQATISSILSLGYLVLGSVQNAWFMFALIQTNMVLVMYLFMFCAVIKLRYSRPDVNRPYEIPGKKVGLWLVSGVGMLVCVIGLLIGFFPTSEANGLPTWIYVLVLIVGTAGFVCMPFIFWIFRKPSWMANEVTNFETVDPEAT